MSIDDEQLRDVVEYVLQDVSADLATVDHVGMEITIRCPDDLVADISGPTPWEGQVPRHEAVARLVTILNRFALEASSQMLCLHAAGAVVEHRGVALVGPSGVGKTTLLAALMRHGASGVCDEMLRVAPDAGSATSWPKPLSIKPGMDAIYPEIAAMARDHSGDFRHVPLSAVGVLCSDPITVDSLLVIRRRGPSDEPALTPLRPVPAAMELIVNLMNFPSFGAARSLETLGRLVSSRPSRSSTSGTRTPPPRSSQPRLVTW